MTNYLYPMLMVLLLWQCNEADIKLRTKEVHFGETFTMDKELPVNVVGEQDNLLLELYTVTDSRCPSDAICVWLGNATVRLKASNANEKDKELEMCIGDCRPDPVRSKHILTTTVGGVDYVITLKEVSPYPKTGTGDGEKQIKLVVDHAAQ
ncbi:hypothetical protein ACSX1A_12485 [Pontibacter sp. MBLB2868]|uniref:hypothetical protein n=1 Tax=Pontibacter sp. MBLB2868 TaxID=3451555 RepID=UPI003F74DD81